MPCGIADAGVTSLAVELGRDVTVAEVEPLLTAHLRDALDPLRAATAPTGGAGVLT